MNRYQNPEVFERLALEYVVGTLQGKARERFETLMNQHFYLKAVTEAYQHKFASLHELLPAVPPPERVWERLERELKLTSATPLSLWQRLRQWRWSSALPLALAGMVLAFSLALLWQQDHEPKVYLAVMKSEAQTSTLAVARVDSQKLIIELPQHALNLTEGLVATLWCLHKDPSKPPIRMGVLNPNVATEMPITPKMWHELQQVETFAISLEPAQAPMPTIPNQVILSGQLVAL